MPQVNGIPVGKLCGWLGDDLARQYFFLINKEYGDYRPNRGTKDKVYLYDFTRKVLGKDTENYAQQVGDPYEPGTMVLMADGSEKPIENVKIGERIINHKNEEATVTDVIERHFTGNMITVKLRGWYRELTATETHHTITLPYTQSRFQYNGCQQKKFGELSIGDYMLLPYGHQYDKDIILDLVDYIEYTGYDDEYVYNEKQKHSKIRRFIPVDDKFARFVGLYLAEGGTTYQNSGITFSLNANETDLMLELDELSKEIFNLETTIQKTGCKNCRRVAIHSRMLSSFVKRIIPGNIFSKRVPTFFFKTRSYVKRALLTGWLDGDGYKNLEKNNVIGYTISKNLATDMARIAMSLGLRITTRSRKRTCNKRNYSRSFEVAFSGIEPHKLYQSENINISTKEITCNDTPYGLARPIQSMKSKTVVNHKVYCIMTENEYTIIVNGIASQNCVSFGAKNAIEYLACVEVALHGESELWRPQFPPYLYGTGRVQIGGGQLSGDGSLGVWQAKAVMAYGSIPSDEEGVPPYSGSVARQWGRRPGPPERWLTFGKQHLVKTCARIRTWEEACEALSNGYPVTLASNRGFTMEAGSDGFHRASGSWAHQMCLIAFDNAYKSPFGIILNSWGNSHGILRDFETGEPLPKGCIRAHAEVIERDMLSDDCWSYSQYQGFPEQDLDKALFYLM